MVLLDYFLFRVYNGMNECVSSPNPWNPQKSAPPPIPKRWVRPRDVHGKLQPGHRAGLRWPAQGLLSARSSDTWQNRESRHCSGAKRPLPSKTSLCSLCPTIGWEKTRVCCSTFCSRGPPLIDSIRSFLLFNPYTLGFTAKQRLHGSKQIWHLHVASRTGDVTRKIGNKTILLKTWWSIYLYSLYIYILSILSIFYLFYLFYLYSIYILSILSIFYLFYLPGFFYQFYLF